MLIRQGPPPAHGSLSMTADIAKYEEMYRQPLRRFAMTACEMLRVGLAISLPTAALLRNPHFMPTPRS